jgi:hypothetical protein
MNIEFLFNQLFRGKRIRWDFSKVSKDLDDKFVASGLEGKKNDSLWDQAQMQEKEGTFNIDYNTVIGKIFGLKNSKIQGLILGDELNNSNSTFVFNNTVERSFLPENLKKTKNLYSFSSVVSDFTIGGFRDENISKGQKRLLESISNLMIKGDWAIEMILLLPEKYIIGEESFYIDFLEIFDEIDFFKIKVQYDSEIKEIKIIYGDSLQNSATNFYQISSSSKINLNFFHLVFQKKENFLQVFAEGSLIHQIDISEMLIPENINKTKIKMFPNVSTDLGIVGLGFYTNSFTPKKVSELLENHWVDLYRACKNETANIDQLNTLSHLSTFVDFSINEPELTGAGIGEFQKDFEFIFDLKEIVKNIFARNYKIDLQFLGYSGEPSGNYLFSFYSDLDRQNLIGTFYLNELVQKLNILETFAPEFNNTVQEFLNLSEVSETGKIYATVNANLLEEQKDLILIDYNIVVISPKGKTMSGTSSSLGIINSLISENWLLKNGIWNDFGTWNDNSFWQDSQ